MKSAINSVLCLAVLSLTGCASIVSKSQYPVTINSNPSGALVTVKDKRGVELQKLTTPSTMMLKAGAGFFSPANYTFQFEKDGYFPASASLSARMDGWYIGNIVFGGLIGWLIVDPATGAMWKLDETVYGNLAENPSAAKPVAKADVPKEPEVPVTTKVPTTAPDDVGTQLKKLKELKEAGVLTDDEYETRRKALVEKL